MLVAPLHGSQNRCFARRGSPWRWHRFKGGASGAIGTAAVAQAEPDGYTFGVVFDTHGVNPSLQKLAFDTQKDLVHVTLIGTGAMVLTASAKAPFKTFAQVVAAARTKEPSG